MHRIGARIAEGRTAEIFEWGDAAVIKLLRAGFPANSLRREAHYTELVGRAGVRCPRTEGVVEIGGRIGLVLERLEGPSMLDEAFADPRRLPELATELGELHAELHRHQVDGLPDRKSELSKEIPAAEHLLGGRYAPVMGLLRDLPSGRALCHGDFHPGNILRTARGTVVIDWNDAASGAGTADVARTRLLLRLYSPDPVLIDTYMERYLEASGANRSDIDAWGVVVAASRLSEGIPEERERLIQWIDHALPDVRG